ncbi:uncharacterized protein LOC116732155 [Xiphophorus hellerii]|uniref:uncharacterized protein LOC116732155 n=1 Tax=Xiphophorus hellerii TaxID=8084 RepID=UPI0013B3A8F7|nr:uncharacterized protein LOC116732155 [Xiphophorus hellerii]
MASESCTIPPYLGLATVKGVVVIRRTPSGIWAGRALKKLDWAKNGVLSEERELLEWKKAKSNCPVCLTDHHLPIIWEGPGREKPRHQGATAEMLQHLRVSPVTILNNTICGNCRVGYLPRLKLETQWGWLKEEPRTCYCTWDGDELHRCPVCKEQLTSGEVTLTGEAEGWQVTRFYSSLRYYRTYGKVQSNYGSPIPIILPGPSAPPNTPEELDPWVWRRDEGPHDVLWDSVQAAWPYDAARASLSFPPLNANHSPVVFRVHRPHAYQPSAEELSALPDDARKQAFNGGWTGPWELTTWAHLILEVINDCTIPIVDLPDAPREDGVRSSDMYYYTTEVDGWGSNAVRPKEKSCLYWVTAESQFRDGVLQHPGGVAHRASTPSDPSTSCQVQLSVRMITVPYKGIYSVGAAIKVVPDEQTYATVSSTEPEPPKKKPKTHAWQKLTSAFPWKKTSQD